MLTSSVANNSHNFAETVGVYKMNSAQVWCWLCVSHDFHSKLSTRLRMLEIFGLKHHVFCLVRV